MFLSHLIRPTWAVLPVFALLGCVMIAGAEDKSAKKRRNADLTEAEEDVVKAINTARKKKDLKPLKINTALVAECRAHAAKMQQRGVSADEFDGKNPGERINGAGVKVRHWGVTSGKGKSLKDIAKTWADDPIAPANILEPHVGELGIGVVTADDGAHYVAALYVEVIE